MHTYLGCALPILLTLTLAIAGTFLSVLAPICLVDNINDRVCNLLVFLIVSLAPSGVKTLKLLMVLVFRLL